MFTTQKDELSALCSNGVTRRGLLQGLAGVIGVGVLSGRTHAMDVGERSAPTETGEAEPYYPAVLPPTIRSRDVNNGNGITMHVLEAGFETGGRPAVVLLHGFPELAFSWRKVMPPLAAAGYHVIAPDLRGYGRTSGWDIKYDDDISSFRTLNEVRDILGLVSAFGYRFVSAVVGHDFGAPMAAWCSIVRPDVFRSLVLMSGPFGGTPSLPFNTADAPQSGAASNIPKDTIYDDLAALTPPRKHYQRYYATREANNDMWHASQGVHAFLRAYYYMKSADWPGNKPFPLKSWTASELAKIPHYYIMELDKGMAETVAPEMPTPSQIAACKWLTEEELNVYSAEYTRTGFQGGLEGYRMGQDSQNAAELRMFSDRTIDVPALFIAGKSDWNTYQRPGALENMQTKVCTQFRSVHLLDGAGHWVQQEQPEEVSRLMIEFLK
jgi:pimeloyl-ACP methyl ester carboxylesterase